jgi:hypothetical protein
MRICYGLRVGLLNAVRDGRRLLDRRSIDVITSGRTWNQHPDDLRELPGDADDQRQRDPPGQGAIHGSSDLHTV